MRCLEISYLPVSPSAVLVFLAGVCCDFDFEAQGFGPLKSELLGYADDFFRERALYVFYYKIRGKLDCGGLHCFELVV